MPPTAPYVLVEAEPPVMRPWLPSLPWPSLSPSSARAPLPAASERSGSSAASPEPKKVDGRLSTATGRPSACPAPRPPLPPPRTPAAVPAFAGCFFCKRAFALAAGALALRCNAAMPLLPPYASAAARVCSLLLKALVVLASGRRRWELLDVAAGAKGASAETAAAADAGAVILPGGRRSLLALLRCEWLSRLLRSPLVSAGAAASVRARFLAGACCSVPLAGSHHSEKRSFNSKNALAKICWLKRGGTWTDRPRLADDSSRPMGSPECCAMTLATVCSRSSCSGKSSSLFSCRRKNSKTHSCGADGCRGARDYVSKLGNYGSYTQITNHKATKMRVKNSTHD